MCRQITANSWHYFFTHLTRTQRPAAMHRAASAPVVLPAGIRARALPRRARVAARASRPARKSLGTAHRGRVLETADGDAEAIEGLIGASEARDADARRDALSSCLFARARRGAAAAVAAAAVAACAGGFAAPPADAITANQQLFLEAWRAVDKAYVDKTFNGVSWYKYREETVKRTSMDSIDQTYDAIRAMLAKLDDPFTRFLEPEKYASLTESTMSANITGVGVEMAYGDGSDEIVVVAPTPGGPADEAGVRPADAITAVDGRPVSGLSLYEVADALQGPASSKVDLSLRRSGVGEEVQVRITRRSYALVPVRSQLCSPAAGTGQKVEYVRLTTFNQLSGAKVKEAVTSGLENGADAFVLDLRSNSGGLFPGALDIAKQFMRGRATIVLIADSDGVRDVFETDDSAIAPDAPLTLLVDKGTASASEVLAGALRDNKRATILGDTETFGKGLIQTVVPLSDGSAVSVTVARYQTPSGADINKVGITPDAPLPAPARGANEEGSALPTEPGAFCAVVAADEGVARALFSR